MKLAIESNGTKLVTKLSEKKTSAKMVTHQLTKQKKNDRNDNGEKGRKGNEKK